MCSRDREEYQCCTAAPNHKLSRPMLPCSFAYECAPTREAVRVKNQLSEGLANLAERLRDRAVELVLLKIKLLQAGEARADAVRDGTWFWDEVKPENYGEELRMCATEKERCVSVVQQLPIINSLARCCLARTHTSVCLPVRLLE